MEEEPNENELEERLYAMLHHVDGTEVNVIEHSNQNQNDALHIVDNTPLSTVRRYWRPQPNNAPYRLNNTGINIVTANNKINGINKLTPLTPEVTKPKEEKTAPSPLTSFADISIFQLVLPQNCKKSIEIVEHDIENPVLELESSDEDEVIEVALPPKPTITIESSDEEEVTIIPPQVSPLKDKLNNISTDKSNGEREISASPVPSIVSSVSDEFIRGDCIALNISSRRADNNSFNFSLHGSDLLVQARPSKKKKKKKNKEATTSTPNVNLTTQKTTPNSTENNTADECFATPKSKTKNKKQKNKSYQVHEKSIPNADVYDSDSNQSSIDVNRNQNIYIVTDKSFPSVDVYESDSSQTEIIIDTPQHKQTTPIQINDLESSDSSINLENSVPITTKQNEPTKESTILVDLPQNKANNDVDICENFIMANVTGFNEDNEQENYNNITNTKHDDIGKFGSTKIPAILNEDLDFDNLKGKDRICRRRRYSLTTLRAEMEKFYNESWGGEDFNHREIQKNMSRDKNLWMIDPKDRMPNYSKRKTTCNYCNRAGHRDDRCRAKPPVCYMCGTTGHYEPGCPSKICVNCGSPNQLYSTMCRNCCSWNRVYCSECGQNGHPASHCPDVWRRYHNTVDLNTPLEESRQTKKHYQMFCSGCTRRGHLIHTCRSTIPFSALPINSPYVFRYKSIYNTENYDNQYNRYYKNIPQDDTITSTPNNKQNRHNKRQSHSPTVHDSHVNKKRNISLTEVNESNNIPKSPGHNINQRKTSLSKDEEPNNSVGKEQYKNNSETTKTSVVFGDNLPDFIPLSSNNHDKRGQVIQDNEVSDTSDVVTSARIYVTNDIIDKLKSNEGVEWLNKTMEKYNVSVESTDVNSFLSIRGKLGDQEAFQSELREWTKPKTNNEPPKDVNTSQDNDSSFAANNIPKNRNNVLRKLTKALDSLKEDIGDPNALYKELMYLQGKHQQLLQCKVVSPKQLMNNRDHMNNMLKKLNMVLLGQAGLADGARHLTELYSLQEKLTNFRQKNIPFDLRQEIGQHYHTIFTALPRSDYSELLKRYYGSKLSPTQFKKKKKEKCFKVNLKRVQKTFNAIPSPPKNQNVAKEVNDGAKPNNTTKEKNLAAKFLVEKTMNELVFYHKKLMHSRPVESSLKKTRVDLVRKLHTNIASLTRNARVSSKTLKKMRKIQEQAQMFLTNV